MPWFQRTQFSPFSTLFTQQPSTKQELPLVCVVVSVLEEEDRFFVKTWHSNSTLFPNEHLLHICIKLHHYNTHLSTAVQSQHHVLSRHLNSPSFLIIHIAMSTSRRTENKNRLDEYFK
nr:hypothetical protein HmN_000503300 [Hymenolepis microstoma]